VSTKAIREHAELLQYFGGTDDSKSFLDDRGTGVQSLLREQATINRSTAQVLYPKVECHISVRIEPRAWNL